jgi:galactose-1-phosphate uridylyltransferase
MQVLARDRPFFLVKLLQEKSRACYESNRSSYWADLLRKETTGERYLFEVEGVKLFVPFAPLRGLNETQAIVRSKSNLLELGDRELRDLAEGMSKMLRFYHEEGYASFNTILSSGPMDEHLHYFDVNLRMISRPRVQGLSSTDAWALPYLLWDEEAVEEPELFAERVKTFLKSKR